MLWLKNISPVLVGLSKGFGKEPHHERKDGLAAVLYDLYCRSAASNKSSWACDYHK